MSEKNEHTNEIENQHDEHIDEQPTVEKTQPSKKMHSWVKNISKQTIIVAVLFFTLGGITTACITGTKHHSKGKQEEVVFRKEQRHHDKKDRGSFETNFDPSENDLNEKKQSSKEDKQVEDNDSTSKPSKSEKNQKNSSNDETKKETENTES